MKTTDTETVSVLQADDTIKSEVRPVAAWPVATTIREQVGARAMFMLGAKDAMASEHGLTFRIRGTKKCNKVYIRLETNDTYTVQFWKVRGVNLHLVSEVADVHADQLLSVIESKTGLVTRL